MRWKLFFGIIFLLVSGGFIFAITEGPSPSEVSITVFEIRYVTFNGDTTDFYSYDEIELSNLSGVILEKTSYGKVEFQEELDIMSMDDGDNIVDFDADVEISDNLINVDEANLPGINKSAILSIYDLAFIEPAIYHNGANCTDCVLISYSGEILVFSTPEFEGVYYAVETVGPYCGDGTCDVGEDCSNCPGDCGVCDDGGDDSGGGGDTIDVPTDTYTGEFDFDVNPTNFVVEMNKGTYYQKKINVTNNGTNDITIGIYVEGVDDFIFPTVKSFLLNPGESKNIRFDIYVSNQRLADVYVGKIRFQSSSITRYTEVILDVKERDALFDIRTEVLKKYINPGGRVRANVSLINMGDLRNFDVELEYKIIDFDKNIYTVKKEDFAINRTYNNIFYLDSPKDIAIGNYLFYVRVLYAETNVSASSYDTFVIEKVSYLSWIILILIILLLMYLAYRWYKSKKYELYEKFKQNVLKKKEKEKISGILPKRDKEIVSKVPELP